MPGKGVEWEGVRGEPEGPLVADLFHRSVIDKAANSGGLGRFWTELAKLRPRPEAEGSPMLGPADQWLDHEMGPFVDFWRTRDRFVRRAWLCLAILGTGRQRPGGYTLTDIRRFARVRSRGAGRRVVKELVELGVLLREKPPGRQPRYRYTRSVRPELAMSVRNEWHRQRVRRLLRFAKDALPGRDAQLPGKASAGTEEGWEWYPPDGYVIGSPRPPSWLLDAFWAALHIARHAMDRALDLPLRGDLEPRHWTPEELWAELRGTVDDSLRALCRAASKVDKADYKDWMERDYDSPEEPVFLAPLTEMVTERIWPANLDDHPEPVTL